MALEIQETPSNMDPIKSKYTRAKTGLQRESYMSNFMYVTGNLQGELEWRFENFSLFHEAIYGDLDKRNSALDEYVEDNKDIIRGEFTDEMDLLIQSRHRTFIMDNEDIINSIRSIADESTSVGLWAIVEQFTSRAYVVLESNLEGVDEDTITPPYRWDRLKDKYAHYGIVLEDIPMYEAANELRVVNNKIKHLYKVDAELASFDRFASDEGKQIKQIVLPMQEYDNACYKFLGCVLESIGKEVKKFLTS